MHVLVSAILPAGFDPALRTVVGSLLACAVPVLAAVWLRERRLDPASVLGANLRGRPYPVLGALLGLLVAAVCIGGPKSSPPNGRQSTPASPAADSGVGAVDGGPCVSLLDAAVAGALFPDWSAGVAEACFLGTVKISTLLQYRHRYRCVALTTSRVPASPYMPLLLLDPMAWPSTHVSGQSSGRGIIKTS